MHLTSLSVLSSVITYVIICLSQPSHCHHVIVKLCHHYGAPPICKIQTCITFLMHLTSILSSLRDCHHSHVITYVIICLSPPSHRHCETMSPPICKIQTCITFLMHLISLSPVLLSTTFALNVSSSPTPSAWKLSIKSNANQT